MPCFILAIAHFVKTLQQFMMDFTTAINLLNDLNTLQGEDFSIRIKGNWSGWLLDTDGNCVFGFNTLGELCQHLKRELGLN
ncbi:hypothetical protein [Allocoleopsis sp.]|uniref:hypothetical protein n=1 Tax=Allocoleopsis sp. TaxID=3088169 RepID=UPI002FCEAF0F